MRFKKLVPSQPRETLSRVICDRCGGPVKDRSLSFGADEITIEAKLGEIYPEGDCRTEELVDCCVDCWPVARAALEAAGFKFRDGQADDRIVDLPWDPEVSPAERGAS